MESARKTELVYPRAARVALVPALLGAGLLFATLDRVFRFFNDDAGASLHPFVVATGWGAFTCGSLLFTAEAVARSRGLRGPYPTCAVCIACGAAGALGGMLYVTPLYVPVEFSALPSARARCGVRGGAHVSCERLGIAILAARTRKPAAQQRRERRSCGHAALRGRTAVALSCRSCARCGVARRLPRPTDDRAKDDAPSGRRQTRRYRRSD